MKFCEKLFERGAKVKTIRGFGNKEIVFPGQESDIKTEPPVTGVTDGPHTKNMNTKTT